MNKEELERLVRVEERLEIVQEDLKELKDDNEKRLDELFVKIAHKIDESKFKWSSIINTDTLKIIAYVVVALTAGGAAASAILP